MLEPEPVLQFGVSPSPGCPTNIAFFVDGFIPGEDDWRNCHPGLNICSTPGFSVLPNDQWIVGSSLLDGQHRLLHGYTRIRTFPRRWRWGDYSRTTTRNGCAILCAIQVQQVQGTQSSIIPGHLQQIGDESPPGEIGPRILISIKNCAPELIRAGIFRVFCLYPVPIQIIAGYQTEKSDHAAIPISQGSIRAGQAACLWVHGHKEQG